MCRFWCRHDVPETYCYYKETQLVSFDTDVSLIHIKLQIVEYFFRTKRNVTFFQILTFKF